MLPCSDSTRDIERYNEKWDQDTVHNVFCAGEERYNVITDVTGKWNHHMFKAWASAIVKIVSIVKWIINE